MAPCASTGAFFIFKNKIFDYIREGEENLWNGPFHRLMEEKQLIRLPVRWLLDQYGHLQKINSGWRTCGGVVLPRGKCGKKAPAMFFLEVCRVE